MSVCLPPGTVLPVFGGPQTGKSTFLRTLAHLNGASWLESRTPASVRCAESSVVLLDNPLSTTAEQIHTADELLAAGAVLIVAVPYPGPALSRLPLEWGLRTSSQGVVVRPQRAMDAEMFGIRLDTAGSEPPGRAVLINGGHREWFQFPGL